VGDGAASVACVVAHNTSNSGVHNSQLRRILGRLAGNFLKKI
jgi:hypothetical protein